MGLATKGSRRDSRPEGTHRNGAIRSVRAIVGRTRNGVLPAWPRLSGDDFSKIGNVVAQICPRWNPLTSWISQIEDFQRAA